MKNCLICGDPMDDGVNVCPSCGAAQQMVQPQQPNNFAQPQMNYNQPMNAQPQMNYNQPMNAQQQMNYNQSVANKKPVNKKAIIIGVASILAVLVVILILNLFIGGGASSKKAAAENFMEACVSKDTKAYIDACYPNKLFKAVIDEEDMTKKEAYAELKDELEYYFEDITKIKNIKIVSEEKCKKSYAEDFEEVIEEYYDCKINISEVCEVEVTYDYYDAEYEEWDSDYDYLILYKVSGKWYVMDEYM